MPQVGFEPTIAAGEGPQTYALDGAVVGTGIYYHLDYQITEAEMGRSCGTCRWEGKWIQDLVELDLDVKYFFYCILQITIYSLLDRVFSMGEVRKGREADTNHRWFTGVVLLG